MLVISRKDGSMDGALQATGMGRVVFNIQGIKEVILKAFTAYQSQGPILPDRQPEEVLQFTRESQARVLAEHLTALLDAR